MDSRDNSFLSRDGQYSLIKPTKPAAALDPSMGEFLPPLESTPTEYPPTCTDTKREDSIIPAIFFPPDKETVPWVTGRRDSQNSAIR